MKKIKISGLKTDRIGKIIIIDFHTGETLKVEKFIGDKTLTYNIENNRKIIIRVSSHYNGFWYRPEQKITSNDEAAFNLIENTTREIRKL